ncbi:hypothetical protein P2G88_09005 [Aliiglaciecola sp. CAU 1673]|uniref:hypothetical protein n=1 Tax=Aliiglaciecola sp. CAU 1673 TaxID=3032595 RepID=UPI0023DB7B03|nr:hypothetical protein [Aliiglaciecola sp. CAU 1673]MDF2178389.1 hypothetical protein [Aliiglaciecola sp. CAU 1673]
MSKTQRLIPVLSLVLVGSLAACTSKQLYQGTMQNRLNACEKYHGEQRLQCREQYQKSYEEYERERQAVLEGKTNTP